MNYITKEKFDERTRMLNSMSNGKNFLETEEGKDENLNKFLNALREDKNAFCYGRCLRLYLFCSIMEWFIENDFLPERKADGSRVVIASDLSMKLYLDMKG